MASPNTKKLEANRAQNVGPRLLFNSRFGKPALAIRDGKLNKKSGRRLATRYIPQQTNAGLTKRK